MRVNLQSVTPDAETNIVEIARVSSSRKDKTEQPEGLINYLIRNKHWSPFEHSYMTVEIVTSKAIGIQLLRHRSFTFQEFSQRYAKVTAFEFFELRKQAEKNRQSSTEVFDPWVNMSSYGLTRAGQEIQNFLKNTERLYVQLLEAGVAKECARMILPMCTQTTIFMTGNIRSWIHFLQLRLDSHAQKEAQEVAAEIRNIFIELFPIISKAVFPPVSGE